MTGPDGRREPSFKEAIGLRYFGELLAKPPPEPEWLIERIWTERGRGWITGEAKLLKTWLAMEISVAVATGCAVFGTHRVVRPGRVLYVTEESDLPHIFGRFLALALGKGIDPAELGDRLLVMVNRGVLLDDKTWQRNLLLAAKSYHPRLTTFDPLTRMHRGDENRARDMAPVLNFLAQLQREAETAIAVVHHANKASEANKDARSGQRIRGTSDFHAWADVGLYCHGARDARAVEVEVELKDAAQPEPFTFSVEFVAPRVVRLGDAGREVQPVRLVRAEGDLRDRIVREVSQSILAFLHERGEEGATTRAVRERIRGAKDHVGAALAGLEEDGRAHWSLGLRNAHVWRVGPAAAPPGTPTSARGRGRAVQEDLIEPDLDGAVVDAREGA